MRLLRLCALFAVIPALAGCGTAARMYHTLGRALHLHGEATESPDHFKIEGHDVRESLAAGGRIDPKPQAAPTELAQR